MNYFTSKLTVADIKKEYRALCSIHHPDRGGDVELMKCINIEYKQALKACDGQTSTDKTGTNHTYKFNDNLEQTIIDKINELLGLNLSDIEIALIGTWIWVSGDTKPHKTALKGAGCKWHSKRQVWYFAEVSKKKYKYNKKASFSDLASTYGYSSFKGQKQAAIN